MTASVDDAQNQDGVWGGEVGQNVRRSQNEFFVCSRDSTWTADAHFPERLRGGIDAIGYDIG
jgi:hypothetical protein